MRTRTLTLVSAAALALGLTVAAGTAAFAKDDTTPDAAEVTLEPMVGGVPTPLFVTPEELAAGHIDLLPGQALIVSNTDGSTYTGAGGSDNDAAAHFETGTTSDDEDEAVFNAGFVGGETGSTTAWITAPDGSRISFEINIVVPAFPAE